MWLFFAFASALFAGVTSVLAKCGIKNTDSTVATAIRTGVVLLMSILMVFLVGSYRGILDISARSFLFLILSGLATGASWLCYFRALSVGDINKVVPVDKSSTILAVLFAFLVLGEPIGWVSGIGLCLIALGTFLMIEKKTSGTKKESKKTWLFYALLSAVFAALTSVLAKIGISGVESNLGTAIRTAVVLLISWLTVFLTGKSKKLCGISGKELLFICLSGLATGASWLCYYRALHDGPASVVVPIDKLSILFTVAFSSFVFREKLSRKAASGLFLLVTGTLLLLVKR